MDGMFSYYASTSPQRGRTAMSCARAKGHSGIVDLLTANGAVVGDDDDNNDDDE